jgi:hypothetical protein
MGFEINIRMGKMNPFSNTSEGGSENFVSAPA